MALPSQTRAPATLGGFVAVLAIALSACNGHQKVFGAITCDGDPCCGGPAGIDCAENPDASCVEPGDACTAIAYGCVNGSVYVDAAVPPMCSASGDSTPMLMLPDAGTGGSPDAAGDVDHAPLDASADGDAGTGDATLD
jgi:hypothetical protein